MTKRIIGLVLALCLIVGLLPMIALADEPHTHTPAGAGTELADQRVNASIDANRTNYGKYVVQYTCADCGATYTEDVAFGPALLHYKTAAQDSGTAESTNYNTWGASNKGSSYMPCIVMNPGDAARYFVTKGGHATFTANSYVEELTDADKIAAGEWNIKMEYPVMGDVILTFKGANIANTAGLWLGRGVYTTTANYKIVVETDSTIKQTGKAVQGAGNLNLMTTGDVTITGPGKLNIISNAYVIGAINTTRGNIILDKADIKLVKEDSQLPSRTSDGIITKNNSLTIKDSKLEVVCYCPEDYQKDENGEYILDAEGKKKNLGYRGLSYSVYAGKDVTIDNSVISIAASMSGSGGSSAGIRAVGKLTIKNSDVTASHGGYAYGRAFMYGELVLDYTNGYKAYNSGSKFTYNKDTGAVTFPTGAAFEEITTANMQKYFVQLVHNCYTANDDFDCTTAATCDLCGKAIGEVLTHVAEPDDGDCTTAVYCANGGCKQIVTPAEAAHTPEADDGDCTTAIKCAKCGTVTTEAKASHTSPADRTSCDQPANCTVCNKALAVGEHTGGTATCKDKATCTVCGEKYGELGDHTGGTATCKDKAKCTVCGEAYGELSTVHTPEADDKDCTTAVKCSVCGGEAIAAQTHKYTNGLDTTCDNEGCEHTRVVEPKPLFTVSFDTSSAAAGNIPSTTGYATVKMNAGDATKYFVTSNHDANSPKRFYSKELTDATKIAAGEWNIKIEYDPDGIPTVTLKNAKIVSKYGIMFGGWNAANEGPVKLVLEGENIIAAEYSYKSALQFLFKGDKGGATIEGPGKLLVSTNAHGGSDSKMGAIHSTKASLTMKNANVTVLTSEEWGCSFGVVVDGGDFTVNGGSLKIVGYDDSKTTHYEGKTTGYNLNANAIYAGVATFKTNEEATNGNFTVEGGAKVTVAVSICKNSNNPNNEAIVTQGKFTIKDSEVEIGLIGKCVDGSKLFMTKPTLEFKDNAYTVTATKTKKPTPTLVAYEYDQYTKDMTAMAPDESKLVDWAETTSLGSITYYKVVAGGTGAGTGGNTGSGTGTGTGTGSNPNTGDVSILLTAAIALSSAVGFAGVTVLRKKEF